MDEKREPFRWTQASSMTAALTEMVRLREMIRDLRRKLGQTPCENGSCPEQGTQEYGTKILCPICHEFYATHEDEDR